MRTDEYTPAYDLAIDPSVSSLGIAFFCEGRLVYAGCVRPTEEEVCSTKEALIVRSLDWHVTGEGIELEKELRRVKRVCIEEPQAHHSKRAPVEKLFRLQSVVGALTYVFDVDGNQIKTVYPRDWKRQMSKKVGNARALKRLTKEEQKTIELTRNQKLNTDILDAVGIGLFAFCPSRWSVKGSPFR